MYFVQDFMDLISIFFTVFILLSTGIYAWLVLSYYRGWRKLPPPPKKKTTYRTKICVLVPARNEEDNIIPLLRSLANQDYPEQLFEVIVVDDHSDDDTTKLVKSFEEKEVQLIHLKDFVATHEIAFKKRAIELAVQKTDSELLINTDADCILPPTWISEFASYYEQTDNQFIVGPVDYHPIDNLFKTIQQIDFLSLMAVTGASVYYKQFNLSNGANMAYTKAAFLQVNGYEGKDQSPSGDDVFLIEKIGNLYPNQVGYLKSRNAIVHTLPCDSFSELIQQRIRWVSKTRHYTNFKTKLTGYLFAAFYISLFIQLFLLPVTTQFLSAFIGQLAVKYLVDFILLFEVTKFYTQRKILLAFPIFEIVHLPFTLIVGILGQFVPYTWKKRQIKQ